MSVEKEVIDIWVDNALITEVGYWEEAIPKNINDNKKLLEKDREFKHAHFPDIVVSENSIILDVGCGPLPRYGDMVNGKKLNYIPADPFAYHYKRLLDKNKAVLPSFKEYNTKIRFTDICGLSDRQIVL